MVVVYLDDLNFVFGVRVMYFMKKFCALGYLIMIATASLVLLPNFVGGCPGSATSLVRGTMRSVQIAVENHYQRVGKYPATMDELMPFLPGGSEIPGGRPGSLINSMTGHDACLIKNQFISLTDIEKKRQSDPVKLEVDEGQVLYSVLPSRQAYAITGCGRGHLEVPGMSGKVLVLTNDFKAPPSEPIAARALKPNVAVTNVHEIAHATNVRSRANTSVHMKPHSLRREFTSPTGFKMPSHMAPVGATLRN